MKKPTSGSVKAEGKSLETLTEEQPTVFRHRRIGFIFQNYTYICNEATSAGPKHPFPQAAGRLLQPYQPTGKTLKADKRIAYQIQAKTGVLSKMDGFDTIPYYVNKLKDLPYKVYAKLHNTANLNAKDCKEAIYQICSNAGIERKHASPSKEFIASLSLDTQKARLYGMAGAVILLACILVIYGVFYLSGYRQNTSVWPASHHWHDKEADKKVCPPGGRRPISLLCSGRHFDWLYCKIFHGTRRLSHSQ